MEDQNDLDEREERPLLLKVLSFVTTLISMVCALLAAIFYGYMNFSRGIVLHSVFDEERRTVQHDISMYQRLWFFRWLAAMVSVPLVLGTCALFFYVPFTLLESLSLPIRIVTSVFFVIAGLLCLTHGMTCLSNVIISY